jgi:hypothetical protein
VPIVRQADIDLPSLLSPRHSGSAFGRRISARSMPMTVRGTVHFFWLEDPSCVRRSLDLLLREI